LLYDWRVTWETEQEAERVSAAFEQLMGNRPPGGGKTKDGVPPGLDAGYLGTFYRDERAHCVYDAELLDPDDLLKRLLPVVGEAAAGRVVFVPSPQSSVRLAAVFRRIVSREWVPDGLSVGCGVWLDIDDAVINVTVGAGTPPEVRTRLEELDPGLVRVAIGGTFHRM
jgi:hypothetical protein